MKAEYIDSMGDDLRVVNSARVSFDKESDYVYLDGDGEVIIGAQYWEEYPDKKLDLKDIKLIHYLAKHNHWTPFSHVFITMRETVPIFVARQRFKHMVGFTYNEVSRRYVDDTPKFFEPKKWRARAENKKQGSSDDLVLELKHEEGKEDLWGDIDNKWHPNLHVAYHNQCSLDLYNWLLESGVAPEQARMILPQSMYTSYYVSGSLAAWARAYKLRSDPHAQLEIRELAKEWDEIIQPLFPVSWKALIQ